MPGIGKSIEIGRRSVAVGGGRVGSVGRNRFMHVGFYFEMMKCFGTGQRWWLYSTVKALDAAELFTLGWLTFLCDLHLNLKKKKNGCAGLRGPASPENRVPACLRECRLTAAIRCSRVMTSK